jgi:outer membrane protein, multidrug efflux system
VILGANPKGVDRGKELDSLGAPRVPASLPSALLRRRPDIEAAEQQLAAADHALDAARDAFMPDVQLAAAGGLVGSTLVPGSPLGVWSFGSSILAPIFSAGRLDAQQDAATARRDQAAFAYRKAALTAFEEVENSLSSVERDEEQETALAAERDSQAHALVLATHRYREGYSPYLDQLDAERGLLSARLALVQARTDRLNAIITLYQSLGGGWRPQ